MKKIITLLLCLIAYLSIKAQIYPLRTYSQIPDNSYLKDTNNEFDSYVGTWKGVWDGKIIYLKLDKITYKYFASINEYRDLLVGRFKTTDLNGNILFDNMNVFNDNVKIYGTYFRQSDDKYQLIYVYNDLCNRSGNVRINFTDSTKTQLQWHYFQDESFIDSSCYYFGWLKANIPQPLPKDIVFTIQYF